ncbi:hypothetical protein MJ877_36325, partial [Mesorhizobium jarvisii]|nr:hypothetical protein [Mesorhizobium jarvisii]
QPTRRRERTMKRFKSARQLQRFVSIHDPIANLFHFPRNTLSSAQQRWLGLFGQEFRSYKWNTGAVTLIEG